MDIKEHTLNLIDELKSTCQTYGMGNDGNEYKIITQIFLYKYLNDKFKKVIKSSSYNSMLHYISMFEGMIESIEIDEYSKHHSYGQELIDKDTIFER